MTRSELEALLPKKTIDACKCDRAIVSWDKPRNSLVCHVCEKLFSERDLAIEECIAALLKADIGKVPSVEEIVKRLIKVREEFDKKPDWWKSETEKVYLAREATAIRSLMMKKD